MASSVAQWRTPFSCLRGPIPLAHDQRVCRGRRVGGDVQGDVEREQDEDGGQEQPEGEQGAGGEAGHGAVHFRRRSMIRSNACSASASLHPVLVLM